MTTEIEAALIVQVPRGGAVDRNWREDEPPSIASGQVIVERLPAGDDGTLEPPEAGEVIMSVLSPEALREPEEIQAAVSGAAPGEQALVILVEAAEYLREDELAVPLDAAQRSHRLVILRLMADA
jgi:hypothetical protein